MLLRAAVQADAAVARAGSEFTVLGRQIAVGGQQLELQGLGGVYTDIFLPLHGQHQANNASLALAAVEAFFGAGPEHQDLRSGGGGKYNTIGRRACVHVLIFNAPPLPCNDAGGE